jgi:hypothetical protein
VSLLETFELADGDLSIDVVPERGFDIAAARFGGERFSWESPLGPMPWQGDFARSFGGGLLVTCGLRNVGLPSQGQPQHGWYSSLPARDIHVDGSTARARVVEAEVPGPTLELRREIAVREGSVRVTDVVRNRSRTAEAAPILYHVNLLWDSVDIDSKRVLPRDADASALGWRELGPPGPERVYEHVGATRAIVERHDVRVTVTSSLPRLWQWIHPDYGVLAIEPANCSVRGRQNDYGEGRLPMLQPGESRTTSVQIGVEAA